MAKGISWVRLFPSDFVADIIDLDDRQRGIYLSLILHYYKRGELPKNMEFIARIPATTKEGDEDLEYILDTYFEQVSGRWVHHRCDYEMDAARSKHMAAVERGRKGGKAASAKRQSSSSASSTASSSASSKRGSSPASSNQNQNQNQKSNLKITPYTPDFETVWKQWPVKEDKQRSFKAWQSKKGLLGFPSTEEMLAITESLKASRNWQEGFVPYLVTWLNGHRWEDEVEKEESPKERIKRIRGGKGDSRSTG